MTGLIIVVLLVGIALYVVYLYNSLVKSRQMTEEGWSGISVQLKRRVDLIPNLLAAVKGYMTHERELLQNITELRSRSEAAQGQPPAERAKVESALSGALVQLKATMENYPDLKANQNVLDFQNGLEEIENEIQMSRRYYNGSARNLNVLVESFPSNLVANRFGFAKAEYFELDSEADKAVPKVQF